MRIAFTCCLGIILLTAPRIHAQSGAVHFPEHPQAGAAFSIATTGSEQAVLYIVGPGQALKHKVTLGESIAIAAGELHNAGHYTAFLVGPSSTTATDFDVLPSGQPAAMSFLAKPSRLPVDLPDGISGVVYLFDAFQNLVLEPVQISFQLSETGSPLQERAISSRDGVAWLKMNSAPRAGNAEFRASVAGVTEKRVVEQVPGDPCNLKMTARLSGDQISLETDPLRDCRGNPVPDGTIVTFSETYNGTQSTVDAPLKRGVARTQVPAQEGAIISVATGVVMGNQIHWQQPASRAEP